MLDLDYRVFISYRGGTDGMEFAENLYQYLTEDPLYESVYGKIFYSPVSAPLGHNFKNDIPNIMKTVNYFIMPLTEDYYADFWDEKNNCPDNESITYLEIKAALAVKSRFICIVFPGYSKSKSFLKKLFADESDKLICSVYRQYIPEEEEDIMRQIGDSITRVDLNIKGMAELFKGVKPSIFLSNKQDTENSTSYPFFQLLFDVKKLTLLNYAASSFLTGADIATTYSDSDLLKYWFSHHLKKGDIEADIVLTDPHSSAAEDAADYKMFPDGRHVETNEIILQNLNRLFHFIKANPNARINVYLTRIALPYGVLITEHKHRENNYMKVDLYSAVIASDKYRPSFYLLESNRKTEQNYSFFKENVLRIMNNYARHFDGHPDLSFLLNRNKHIIHRGVIKGDIVPHTKQAYEACLEKQYPIEVDLLEMADGTIIVARDDLDLSSYGISKSLSELERNDLNRINRQSGRDMKIFTLEEFLDFIAGRIPLLIEIKTKEKYISDSIRSYVERVVSILHDYSKTYTESFRMRYNSEGIGFAVHSANPRVLQLIKEKDCLIPCGVITKDFSDIKDVVGDEFYEWHKNASYVEILKPDFISCDVHYIENDAVRKVCRDLKIPMIVWTIIDSETQEIAMDYECANIIIEGNTNYS